MLAPAPSHTVLMTALDPRTVAAAASRVATRSRSSGGPSAQARTRSAMAASQRRRCQVTHRRCEPHLGGGLLTLPVAQGVGQHPFGESFLEPGHGGLGGTQSRSGRDEGQHRWHRMPCEAVTVNRIGPEQQCPGRHGQVVGHEAVRDADRVAAGRPHAGGEPHVLDLHLGPGDHQEHRGERRLRLDRVHEHPSPSGPPRWPTPSVPSGGSRPAPRRRFPWERGGPERARSGRPRRSQRRRRETCSGASRASSGTRASTPRPGIRGPSTWCPAPVRRGRGRGRRVTSARTPGADRPRSRRPREGGGAPRPPRPAVQRRDQQLAASNELAVVDRRWHRHAP